METIRAMTWNVWWRFGGNWQQRQPGVLAVVQKARPDLIGIQECWATAEHTQADVIAEAVGARSAFLPIGLPPVPDPVEEPTQAGALMGLGLVSRWPIAAVARAPLPSQGRDLAALVATVDHPRGELRVVVGVTSWEPELHEERTQQVGQLQRLTVEGASDRLAPSILLADLNCDRSQPPLADLRLHDAWDAADPAADPRTLSSTNRFASSEASIQYERRIDHVLFAPGTAGAIAAKAWIVRDEPDGLPPSDHYPVVADITLRAANSESSSH